MLQSISQMFVHTQEYSESQTEAEFNQQPATYASMSYSHGIP
jgi:hypothetical protein